MSKHNGSDKVIVISGNVTTWYEKAIYILKDTTKKDDVNINMVYEAEKIVQNYINDSCDKYKSSLEYNKVGKYKDTDLNKSKELYGVNNANEVNIKSSSINNYHRNRKVNAVLMVGLIFSILLLLMGVVNLFFH